MIEIVAFTLMITFYKQHGYTSHTLECMRKDTDLFFIRFTIIIVCGFIRMFLMRAHITQIKYGYTILLLYHKFRAEAGKV